MGRKPLRPDQQLAWVQKSAVHADASTPCCTDDGEPLPPTRGAEPCMEQVLHGLSDACLIIDGLDRIIFSNDAAKAMLRPKGRILGRKLDSLLGDRQVSLAAAEASSSGKAAILRVTLRLPGDAWRDDGHFQVSLVPVWLSETRRFVRIALRDESAHPQRGTPTALAADVAVQLKNPLSIVQGYLENLLDGMISDPVLLRQSLLTMRKHTLQIERVIDSLGK